MTFKTTLFLLYFDTLKLHSQFSRKRSYRFFLQFCHRRDNYVKSEMLTSYVRNYLWWQVIRSNAKWGMASSRCYGNSDLGDMYPILNFHLSLAHH